MAKTKKREQRDAQIAFRLPTSLKRALEREAERDHRSVADVLNLILMEGLSKRGSWR